MHKRNPNAIAIPFNILNERDRSLQCRQIESPRTLPQSSLLTTRAFREIFRIFSALFKIFKFFFNYFHFATILIIIKGRFFNTKKKNILNILLTFESETRALVDFISRALKRFCVDFFFSWDIKPRSTAELTKKKLLIFNNNKNPWNSHVNRTLVCVSLYYWKISEKSTGFCALLSEKRAIFGDFSVSRSRLTAMKWLSSDSAFEMTFNSISCVTNMALAIKHSYLDISGQQQRQSLCCCCCCRRRGGKLCKSLSKCVANLSCKLLPQILLDSLRSEESSELVETFILLVNR